MPTTGYINLPVTGGSGVTSLDGLVGALTLVAGTGITITDDGVDEITISNSQAALTLTPVGASPNANGASLSGQALTLQPANASFPGVLLAADWTTFNNKQPAGDYITALTGDVVATGPGSVTATIQPEAVTYAKIQDVSAYSMLVNDTASPATLTETAFHTAPTAAYVDSITWVGAVAPSGTTDHTYRWVQVGNRVTFSINLKYSAAGTANTAVNMALPASSPAPMMPSGFSGAYAIAYFGVGAIANTVDGGGIGTTLPFTVLRRNAADNGFEIVIAFLVGDTAASAAWFTVDYFTS